MINLSVNAINQRAPYKVEEMGDNSFMFETKHGIVYSVGFLQDISFYGEGVYQFYLINMAGKTISADKNISETVRVIIEEFFAHKESVMLYICDTTDGRQAPRDRLFRIWFEAYMLNGSYSLHTESMIIDNIRYYSSILMRKDHPKLVQVLSSFTNFFREHSQE
jgi:hypothetical protein